MTTTPIILTYNSRVDGAKYIGKHKFKSGHQVPLYELNTTGALNQIIGHAKFNNSEYGRVYYRGISGLYDNVLPALMRKRARGIPDDLTQILKSICENPYLKESLKLRDLRVSHSLEDKCINKRILRFNKYCAEALLQHYAGSTRFLDIVDNHWIAIWMGLHTFHMHGKRNIFCETVRRTIDFHNLYDAVKNGDISLLNKYVYLLLIAIPHSTALPEYGITESEKFVIVDLRQALPSIYLRPHAQHALVVRKIDKHNVNQTANYYDLSEQVIGVLRIRVDIASEWLGMGMLATQQNLFPSPSIDQGYNNLLMHPEIFKHPFEIIKYY